MRGAEDFPGECSLPTRLWPGLEGVDEHPHGTRVHPHVVVEEQHNLRLGPGLGGAAALAVDLLGGALGGAGDGQADAAGGSAGGEGGVHLEGADSGYLRADRDGGSVRIAGGGEVRARKRKACSRSSCLLFRNRCGGPSISSRSGGAGAAAAARGGAQTGRSAGLGGVAAAHRRVRLGLHDEDKVEGPGVVGGELRAPVGDALGGDVPNGEDDGDWGELAVLRGADGGGVCGAWRLCAAAAGAVLGFGLTGVGVEWAEGGSRAGCGGAHGGGAGAGVGAGEAALPEQVCQGPLPAARRPDPREGQTGEEETPLPCAEGRGFRPRRSAARVEQASCSSAMKPRTR